jgi:hypothetical protein
MKANLSNIVEGRAREMIRVHGSRALNVARGEARLARARGDHRGARQYPCAARIQELQQDKFAPYSGMSRASTKADA